MFSRFTSLNKSNLIGNKWINSLRYSSKFNFSTSKEYIQPFRILDGSVKKETETFKENQAAMHSLINHLNETLNEIRSGGSLNAIKKHTERGKLMVRDRINKILDPGSPFLELSPLAGYGNMEINEETGKEESKTIAAGGIITGIGRIHNIDCMIVANDATVSAGIYHPITVKKHVRAQEIALQCNLPCIYMVDSGGANLTKQYDVFPDKEHFGRIFYNQARLSANKIPQIAIVMGSCTAGGAYIPAMCDESVIVRKQGTIFLGGVPLVKAATDEDTTEEELGGADIHCKISGVADYYAENDLHALEIGRNIVSNLNYFQQSKKQLNIQLIEEPKYDINDILGLIPPDVTIQMDIRKIISRIVDGSKFDEFKMYYGQTLVTGFANIDGMKCGIVANNGVLFSDSAQKGAHFIELCAQRKIPLIFLQNITGFMVGTKVEHEGIAKHGAKMVTAVSCANVPKITVIVGGSFGAGNYAMCGRAYNPRFLFMWPNSRISVMGGNSAKVVLSILKETGLNRNGQKWDQNDKQKFQQAIIDKYETEGQPYFASSRLWDDGVIDPRETRKVLSLSLKTVLNAPLEDTTFGVFRM